MSKRALLTLAALAVVTTSSISYTRIYDERMLANVSVGGIPISGFSVPEAESAVADNSLTILDDTVQIEINGKLQEFSYEELGADIDIYRTLEKAYLYGHSGDVLADFSSRLTALVQHQDITPVFYSDTKYMAAVIADRTGLVGLDVDSLIESAYGEEGFRDSPHPSAVKTEII